MKGILLGTLLLVSCTPAAHPEPARAMVPIDVRYRVAASAFEILDNVSSWQPGKAEEEYRTYWKERFGLGPADEARFAAYAEVRRRYWVSSPPPTGLFAQPKPPDRLAEAFYGAAELAAAFAAAAAFVSADDLLFLRGFYADYRAPLAALEAESAPYAAIAAEAQAHLERSFGPAYAARLAHFYGVAELPRLEAVYVWWPPVDAMTANPRGRFVILKYHPTRHRESALRPDDVIVHEYVHLLSMRQPAARQEELATAFRARCDVSPTIPAVRVLEEPLAVAHQKIFLAATDAAGLSFARGWYGDPWTSTFAKLIYPLVKKSIDDGGTLDASLVASLGKTCAELKAVGTMLGP